MKINGTFLGRLKNELDVVRLGDCTVVSIPQKDLPENMSYIAILPYGTTLYDVSDKW